MTIYEWAVKWLIDRGMFQHQATEVVALAEADEINEAMMGRWEEPIAEYPACLLGVLAVTLRHSGLAYITKRCPRAWFRPMFEDAEP